MSTGQAGPHGRRQAFRPSGRAGQDRTEPLVSKITPRDIDSIAQLFEAGEWNTLELQVGATEVFLSKRPGARPSWDRVGGSAPQRTLESPLAVGPRGPVDPVEPVEAAAPKPLNGPTPAGHVVIPAPSLGTFYRAPKPGDPPFVEIGQVVTVLASDGAMIELGQPLFLIDARE